MLVWRAQDRTTRPDSRRESRFCATTPPSVLADARRASTPQERIADEHPRRPAPPTPTLSPPNRADHPRREAAYAANQNRDGQRRALVDHEADYHRRHAARAADAEVGDALAGDEAAHVAVVEAGLDHAFDAPHAPRHDGARRPDPDTVGGPLVTAARPDREDPGRRTRALERGIGHPVLVDARAADDRVALEDHRVGRAAGGAHLRDIHADVDAGDALLRNDARRRRRRDDQRRREAGKDRESGQSRFPLPHTRRKKPSRRWVSFAL